MVNNILAVIPAYNESAKIADVISRVRRFAQQVIVVNDGSTDNTQYLAEAAGALVLEIQERTGNSNALIRGFKFAIQNGFHTVVTIDADGAHNPEEIPSLLTTHINLKCHLTIGNRFDPSQLQHIPSTKRWSNFFAASMVNRILGLSLNDVACGFRVLQFDLLKALIKNSTLHGYAIAYEMIAVARGKSFKIGSSPVRVHYDASNILCTRQQEFLDLLRALINMQFTSKEMLLSLNQIYEVASNLQPFTIKIAKMTLCIHPLLTEGGYLFQLQDQNFTIQTIGQYFDLDIIN